MYVVKTPNGTPWSHDQLTLDEAIVSRKRARKCKLIVHIYNALTGERITSHPVPTLG